MIMAWPNAVDNTIFISSIISMKKINAVDIHIGTMYVWIGATQITNLEIVLKVKFVGPI